MIAIGFFEIPASLLAWLYGLTNNYALAIGIIAVILMTLITPLTLKSTKGMLEMQRLAPEMRKLQAEYRNDRQKLNEEMMKLYQEHKVNPMASCLPMLAQMPIFIVMFRVLHDLTYSPSGGRAALARGVLAAADSTPQEIGFLPRYVSHDSDLYRSLAGSTEMKSFGFDLSRSTAGALADGIVTGLPYALLVVLLAALYFGQQRMVAARATVSPTMSPTQQKLMQYLPVVFAVFQIFFVAGLVVYYITQTVLRILQQFYITRTFYGHDESLGRQAQRASERARELSKEDGGGGFLSQARKQLSDARGGSSDDDAASASSNGAAKKGASAASKSGSSAKSGSTPKKKGSATNGGGSKARPSGKATTPPKQRPTSSAKRPAGRPGSGTAQRPKGTKKKRR